MATFDTTKNDVSQRRTDKDHPLEQFKGVEAQLVVDTNDNYRIAVMDGKQLGGIAHVALLESAPFKRHPTTKITKDLDKLEYNMLVAKSEVEMLIKKELGLDDPALNPDGTVTIQDLLANKIDHTKQAINDLNTLTDDGFYYVLEAVGAPEPVKGYVHVISDKTKTDCHYQFFYNIEADDTKVWVRKHLREDSWSEWKQGLYLKDVNTVVLTTKQNVFLEDAVFKKNVTIEGELSSPSLDAKADHTTSSVVTDLDLLTQDGTFYYDGLVNVLNKPLDGITDFFISVMSMEKEAVYQVLFGINRSGFYLRRKPVSGMWTTWSKVDGLDDIPDASLTTKGLVQLTSEISDREDFAITPKAVRFVLNKANRALINAEANEKTITDLVANLGTIIKSITIPNSENSSDYDELEIDKNGKIRLPLAAPSSWGLARPASAIEVNTFRDVIAFVTPALLKSCLITELEGLLSKVLDEANSDVVIKIVENVSESLVTDKEFIQELLSTKTATNAVKEIINNNSTEIAQSLATDLAKELNDNNLVVTVQIQQQSSFDESTAKLNTLYLLTE